VYVNGVALNEPFKSSPTIKEGKDFPMTVPEGYLFLMGDNRSHSTDSRSDLIGMVSENYILGKVVFRVLPFGQFKV